LSIVVTLLLAHPDSEASSVAQHSAEHDSARCRQAEFDAPIRGCSTLHGAMMGRKIGAMAVRMFLLESPRVMLKVMMPIWPACHLDLGQPGLRPIG
jgi:hypothetical protein